MITSFKERLKRLNPSFINFDSLKTLQINVGNLCNLSCTHCHVSASSRGKKIMGQNVMNQISDVLSMNRDIVLDITGGCPEINPNFRYLVESTKNLSPRRILRSNLAIMTEPGMEWLPDFCRKHNLVIIASMPCYLEENVDRQRGRGVYARCISTLKRLNMLGYGKDTELNLVFNPSEDFLPGSQTELEADYKKELFDRHKIVFNNLFTITNAPIGRFRDWLDANGNLERYLNLLFNSFNPDACQNIMCRNLISVDWQGVIYNCDFNQALGLPIISEDNKALTIKDIERAAVKEKELVLSQHCYCCTAGSGSSCTGALAAA